MSFVFTFPNIVYRCHCVIPGSIVASFDIVSSSVTALDGMLDAIASDVRAQKAITFEGKQYKLEKSMLVNEKSYGNVETAVSDVRGLSTVCLYM